MCLTPLGTRRHSHHARWSRQQQQQQQQHGYGMTGCWITLLLLLAADIPASTAFVCKLQQRRHVYNIRNPLLFKLPRLGEENEYVFSTDNATPGAVHDEGGVKKGFGYYLTAYGPRYAATWVFTYLSILALIYLIVSTRGNTFGFDPESLVVKVCSFLQSRFGERDWITFITENKRFYGNFFVSYLTTDLIPTTLIAGSILLLSVRMQGGDKGEV